MMLEAAAEIERLRKTPITKWLENPDVLSALHRRPTAASIDAPSRANAGSIA
jgi:hypothetical protein